MKCVSCEANIDPKWSHAIDINVCPFCGKSILEEHLRNLLSSLAQSMAALQQYPSQLDDWLLSNYNYIKTDSEDLKSYLSKDVIKELRREIDDDEFQQKKQTVIKIKTPGGGEEEVLVEKVQSQTKTNQFFERAEAIRKGPKERGGEVSDAPKSISEKTQYLKEMANKIKSEGSNGIVNETGLASMISPDMIDNADPEAVAEYQSIINSGDIISSGLPDISTGDDDDIPPQVQAMANRAKKGTGGGANQADLQSLHEMQSKIKNAAKSLASGKGGFSRA